jgi:predicted nucleic acid-binding protein
VNRGVSPRGALWAARRVFLDSAPVIYYVEDEPVRAALIDPIFRSIDEGRVDAVTTLVTVLECLTLPVRLGRDDLEQRFIALLVANPSVRLWPLDLELARLAAQLRAGYRLQLGDAIQLSAALHSGCDAFLTNDVRLRRVREVPVVVVDDLEP